MTDRIYITDEPELAANSIWLMVENSSVRELEKACIEALGIKPTSKKQYVGFWFEVFDVSEKMKFTQTYMKEHGLEGDDPFDRDFDDSSFVTQLDISTKDHAESAYGLGVPLAEHCAGRLSIALGKRILVRLRSGEVPYRLYNNGKVEDEFKRYRKGLSSSKGWGSLLPPVLKSQNATNNQIFQLIQKTGEASPALNIWIDKLIIPLLTELEYESHKTIRATIKWVSEGEILSQIECSHGELTNNGADVEIRISLKDGWREGLFDYKCFALVWGISEGTGFTGFEGHGKVDLSTSPPEVREQGGGYVFNQRSFNYRSHLGNPFYLPTDDGEQKR